MVNIDHGDGWGTSYLHMDEMPMVQAGQWVTQGQPIGRVGRTGNAPGSYHLHYQQWNGGSPSNTVRSYFNGVPVNIAVGTSQILTSQNCGGSSANSGTLYQVYGTSTGWNAGNIGITIQSVSAVNMGGQWPQAMTIR